MNKSLRVRALTPALGALCALLAGLGAAGLDRTDAASGGPVKAWKPVEVEESLLPPHREPPAPATSEPLPPPAPLPSLRERIHMALSASGAAVRAASVSVDGIGLVAQYDADRELVPASTQKLVVASAALGLLGADHVYTTRVIRVGPIAPDGTLQGDLGLVGGGDPSLSRDDLNALARAVASAGIKRVGGGVVGDESRYDRARGGVGWKPSFLTHESGSLSALAVDQNAYRNDPEFSAEPALANTQLFRQALLSSGVEVAGPAVIGSVPVDPQAEMASKQSPALKDLLTHMLMESDNFYAEMIVKEMGFRAGSPTTAGGLEAIARFAAERRLPSGKPFDGSGLSSENRQTANGQVLWLEWIGRNQPQIIQMLPSACRHGSLKTRMCGSTAEGNVTAKSGGLQGVATLAGYARTASGRRVTFSFFLIGSPSGKAARLAMDEALGLVTSFDG